VVGCYYRKPLFVLSGDKIEGFRFFVSLEKTGVVMFLFIVDTDSYAGNFERVMTAFMTGHYGDCGTGAEVAKPFAEKYGKEWVENLSVKQVADEYGCFRPCSIYTTPDWFNDGHGNHYRNNDPKAPKLEKTYPAYNSFAIFLSKKPSEDQIKFMQDRANEWVASFKSGERQSEVHSTAPNAITGFRLLEQKMMEVEVWSAENDS